VEGADGAGVAADFGTCGCGGAGFVLRDGGFGVFAGARGQGADYRGGFFARDAGAGAGKESGGEWCAGSAIS